MEGGRHETRVAELGDGFMELIILFSDFHNKMSHNNTKF